MCRSDYLWGEPIPPLVINTPLLATQDTYKVEAETFIICLLLAFPLQVNLDMKFEARSRFAFEAPSPVPPKYSSVPAPDLGTTLDVECWTDPTQLTSISSHSQTGDSFTNGPKDTGHMATLGVRRSSFSPDFVTNSLCYLSQVASLLWVLYL